MTSRQILSHRAGQLRINMTEAEQSLWYHLRDRRFKNLKFRLQVIINNYIVDFICVPKKIIIELDGAQHFEQRSYDEQRTRKLKSKGYRVIRFWNHEVLKSIDVVLEKLNHFCDENFER